MRVFCSSLLFFATGSRGGIASEYYEYASGGGLTELSSDGSLALLSRGIWEPTTGKFTSLPNNYFGRSFSADGAFVAVTKSNPVTGSRSSYRWSQSVGLERVGGLRDDITVSRISADGSVISGGITGTNGFSHPFIWTEETGVVQLPLLPGMDGGQARVSANGQAVIGFTWDDPDRDNRGWVAYRWTEEFGTEDLGKFGNKTWFSPTGISHDGSVIVGTANERHFNPDRGNVDPSEYEAFLWTESEGMRGLGAFPGHDQTLGAVVSHNGDLVLGNGFLEAPGPFRGDVGDMYVWTESRGMASLTDIIESEVGVRIEGRDGAITSISDDNRVIAGYSQAGGNPWVVVFDEPLQNLIPDTIVGDFTGDQLVTVDDVDTLGRAIREGSALSYYDLDESGVADTADLEQLVHSVFITWFGDANLDGEFNSSDLVNIFEAGEYEDGIPGNSTWASGDWNADGDFTTADLVAAFVDGGYEQGPRTAISAVPEPSSIGLALLGASGLLAIRHRTGHSIS